MTRRITVALVALVLVLLVVGGCAPGNDRWASVDSPAGFWAGLWHGIIIIVTFVVTWFTNDVGIYESNNVGFWYNIGFILGCMISLGGGIRAGTHRKRKVKVIRRGPDPERIARRVERGVREGLKAAFADRVDTVSENEWDELGRRVEERVKEEMKDLEDGD